MDQTNSTRRTVGKTLVVAAGLGIGLWIVLIVFDLLSVWWIYSVTNSMLFSRGLDENLAKIAGLGFAGFVAFMMHGLLQSLLMRDRKWVPRVVGIMTVWFLAMFLVSIPYSGGVYNIFTTKATMKYYRTADSVMVAVPLGAKTGPEGQAVHDFDQKSAEEYKKQEEERGKDGRKSFSFFGVFNRLIPELETTLELTPKKYFVVNYGFRRDLDLWVEKLQITPDKTVLYFACRGRDNGAGGTLDRFIATYLADDQGRVYRQDNSSVDYKDKGFFSTNRNILAGEIYHFSITFPPLVVVPSTLQFYDSRLDTPLDLSSLFKELES